MSNVPQWWITDRNDRILAGPFTSEENTEPVMTWITVLDRDDPDAAAVAYGVRRPDSRLERKEPAQWWVIERKDHVLTGPFTSRENAEEAVLWTEATHNIPPDALEAEYGVRRPDGTLERQSPPPEAPQWWVIDRNDHVLVGPFTSEEDAESAVIWVKAAAPFKVDGGLDAVAAAYGVRRRDETLEHRSPTG